jgi:hypothetical protein
MGTQVEGHKGSQAGEQHRHRGARIPRHSEVDALGVWQAQLGRSDSFQAQLPLSLCPGLG